MTTNSVAVHGPSHDRQGSTLLAAIASSGFLLIAIDWGLGAAQLLKSEGSWTESLLRGHDSILNIYGFVGIFAALRLTVFGLRGRHLAGTTLRAPWVRLAIYGLIFFACLIEASYPSTKAQFLEAVDAQAVRDARALGFDVTHWHELPGGDQNPKTEAIKFWASTRQLWWFYDHRPARALGAVFVATLWLLALLAELSAALWRAARRVHARRRAA